MTIPAIIGAAVEELLRRFPTAAVGTGRLCVEDTELGGAHIKTGDKVMTSTAMPNFDAEMFPDPLTVDFARRLKQIGTFGGGVHHCVGDGLTRLELTTVLQEWLSRIPDVELADRAVTYAPGATISPERTRLRWPLR